MVLNTETLRAMLDLHVTEKYVYPTLVELLVWEHVWPFVSDYMLEINYPGALLPVYVYKHFEDVATAALKERP